MLSFLKAPANAPLITDKHEVDARYRYWRRHILITIWLGYALFYFTRKSFNAAAPEILASGILTRSDIGLLATLFYITYGVSKFVSGIVSDRSNARYFMGIGLIATGVVNILFGFSTSLWAFALLWALNAFFQGFGSPVCARLLTAWYSRTDEFNLRRRDFALCGFAVADAVRQLRDAGGLFLHHRFLCLRPADAHWHGGGGVLA